MPIQIGKDGPKKEDRKGHVEKLDGKTVADPRSPQGPAGLPEGADPLDPRYEQAVGSYRSSYLYWGGEQKQLEDNVGGNTLAFSGAYTRIVSHLSHMGRYLAPESQEKLASYVRQYKSMYDLVSSGNRGRFVARQVVSLGDHVRSDFRPGAVTIVPLAQVGPEVPDTLASGDEPTTPGGGTAASGAATGLGAGNPRAPQGYVAAYADWRAYHKSLVDALFSETPKIDEHYKNALAALERMKADLPNADKDRLQMFVNEYANTAKGFVDGVSARRTVNQFRMIADELEKNFAPEAVAFP